METDNNSPVKMEAIAPEPVVAAEVGASDQFPNVEDNTAGHNEDGAAPAAGAGEKGPLGRLSERAYQSPIVQKATDNIPPSVRPILKRGAEGADRAIAVVDETLQTDEARRVAGSAMDLVQAMGAFTMMVLSMTATRLESLLNIPTPSSQTSQNDEAATTEREAESAQQKEKAFQLLSRYGAVLHACFQKLFAKKPSSPAGSETPTAGEQEEQVEQDGEQSYDPHSIDKVVRNNVKQGVKLAKQVGAYSLSQASQFKGRGSSAIAPTADYIISKLPEDAKRVVSESHSPFH